MRIAAALGGGEPDEFEQVSAMAEGVGFEPTMPCGIPVFKTGAIDRSATPPGVSVSQATRDYFALIKVSGKQKQ